jgi:hypothetical protein
MRILVNPFDEAERLSRQHGKWIVCVVETRVFWPQKKQVMHFDGRDFVLMPMEHYEGVQAPTLPAIALRADIYCLADADARKEILRFASALAWREGGKIEIVSWSGGNLPRSIGILRNSGRTDYVDAEHLPAPSSDAARTALAFYREGISLDNPFYSFLSLYKAFCVAVSDGRTRGEWIMNMRSVLDDDRACARLAEIEGGGKEVGSYLQEQCRHAVAHADREPFVNPDNTDDHLRLTKDVPLMRNFVELAIEEAFGVKRRSTIYHEHLFELGGFRELFPNSVVESLKLGEELPNDTEIELPERLLLLARRGHESHKLPQMTVVDCGWTKGGLVLCFRSVTGTVELCVMLDFLNERLQFDPIRGFRISQDRSDKGRAEEELAALRFHRCILSNAHLEIWNSGAETRLGSSDAYIPLNCFVNADYFDAEISTLESLLSGTVAGAP